MSRVFAVTSHKGGTGRSTTTANIAYRLACSGDRVCIVDLDLASPTAGAILELEGYESGALTGIHDLLPRHSRGPGGAIDAPKAPAEALDLVKSVNDLHASEYVRKDLRANAGQLDLLPGKVEMNESLAEFDILAPVLDSILQELIDQYDWLFLDVRSGTDSPLYALAQGQTELTWLVFYRWTPQHLAGYSRLVTELRDEMGQPEVLGVRTAFIDPLTYQGSPGFNWFVDQDQTLKGLARQLLGPEDPTIATIVRNDTLLWKEGILSPVEFGASCGDVINDYDRLTDKLRGEQ